MCDCCDPTADSPDPVVVRLEREVDDLTARLADAEDELASRTCPRCNVDGYWYRVCQINTETINKLREELRAARNVARFLYKKRKRGITMDLARSECPWVVEPEEAAKAGGCDDTARDI